MPLVDTCLEDFVIMYETTNMLVLKSKQAFEVTTSQAVHPSTVGSSSLRLLDSPSGIERTPCSISSSSVAILSPVIAPPPSMAANLELVPPTTQSSSHPTSTEPPHQTTLTVPHKRYNCVISQPPPTPVSTESSQPSLSLYRLSLSRCLCRQSFSL